GFHLEHLLRAGQRVTKTVSTLREREDVDTVSRRSPGSPEVPTSGGHSDALCSRRRAHHGTESDPRNGYPCRKDGAGCHQGQKDARGEAHAHFRAPLWS